MSVVNNNKNRQAAATVFKNGSVSYDDMLMTKSSSESISTHNSKSKTKK